MKFLSTKFLNHSMEFYNRDIILFYILWDGLNYFIGRLSFSAKFTSLPQKGRRGSNFMSSEC